MNSRFRECQLKYNNNNITVEQLPEARSAAEAAKIFNQLIDENYPLPNNFPYNVTTNTCKPLLLFLGDEIQVR